MLTPGGKSLGATPLLILKSTVPGRRPDAVAFAGPPLLPVVDLLAFSAISHVGPVAQVAEEGTESSDPGLLLTQSSSSYLFRSLSPQKPRIEVSARVHAFSIASSYVGAKWAYLMVV